MGSITLADALEAMRPVALLRAALARKRYRRGNGERIIRMSRRRSARTSHTVG